MKKDIKNKIDLAYKKQDRFIDKPKVDRLLEIYKIVKDNLAKGETINLVEWYYPHFYLEVTNNKYSYPMNIRFSLSYDVNTGTIMDEVLEGKKTDNFHGCVRGKHYQTRHKIENQLNTKFFVPIRTK